MSSLLGRFLYGLAWMGVVFFPVITAEAGWIPTNEEETDESVLLVGVPNEFYEAFQTYLNRISVPYRFDSKTRTFYVRGNSIEILKGAQKYEVLSRIAQRGLWEHQAEEEIHQEWPSLDDPRVCVSLPSYFPGDKAEGEPIAFVIVEGLESKEVPRIKLILTAIIPGLPSQNIRVMGTDWRPGPGYVRGTRRIAQAQ